MSDIFYLENNGDIASVRFLFKDFTDLYKYSRVVHMVRYPTLTDVPCPGEGCPICAKGYHATSRTYIPLYNIDKKRIQFWSRYSSELQTLFKKNKLDTFNNLPSWVFEIQRRGITFSRETYYTATPIDRSYDEVGDIPSLDGTMIKQLSLEELKAAVEWMPTLPKRKDA